MAVSDVSICNLALAKLGERPIVALSENSQVARYCSTFYETSRDAALREYPWNFANANRTLASITVPDGYDKWSYAFGYPQNCLNVLKVHDDGGNEYPFKVGLDTSGTIDAKIILANVEAAYLNYTAKITDPSLFDSQFIEAFACYLAKELAWPVSKNSGKEQIMYQKYLAAIPKAQTADAQEETVEVETSDPWITDRLA